MAVHPAGFLASRSRTGRPPPGDGREPPGHLGDRGQPARGPPPSGPAAATPPAASSIGAAAMAAMAALARLNWPGQPDADAVAGSRRPAPGRRRRATAATSGRAKSHRSQRPPPVGAELDPPPHAGQPDGVVVPHLAGPDPATSGAAQAAHATIGSSALATTTVPRPVGRVGAEQPGQGRPPPVDQHPHLGDPVELVPRQVEEDDHPGRGLGDEPAEIALVDLEHGQPALAGRRPARPRGRPACWPRCRW